MYIYSSKKHHIKAIIDAENMQSQCARFVTDNAVNAYAYSFGDSFTDIERKDSE